MPKPTALLEEAQRLRERALQHRALVLQSQSTPVLDDATFEHVRSMLELANEKELQARRALADEQHQQQVYELEAPAPVSEPASASAAVVTAVALPGGMMLGAAAIAVAPYVGLDPAASFGLPSARGRVSATIRRDCDGRFKIALREDGGGTFISSLHATDADGDERARLKEGDYLFAIDGARVRSDPARMAVDDSEAHSATAPAVAPPAARSADSSRDAGASSSADASSDGVLLGCEDVKARVRDAAGAITLEVWREGVRPVVERLSEFHERSLSEVHLP